MNQTGDHSMDTSLPSKRIEPFLLGVGLLFLVVFLVNGAFVYWALHSFTGLVTDKAYDQGVAFNETIQAQQKQDALGWQGEVTTVLQSGQSGSVQFTLRDRSGQPVSGARVTGLLFRPVQAGMDQPLILAEGQPGVYQGTVTVPQPGQWEVRLEATAPTGSFRHARRIQVPLSTP